MRTEVLARRGERRRQQCRVGESRDEEQRPRPGDRVRSGPTQPPRREDRRQDDRPQRAHQHRAAAVREQQPQDAGGGEGQPHHHAGEAGEVGHQEEPAQEARGCCLGVPESSYDRGTWTHELDGPGQQEHEGPCGSEQHPDRRGLTGLRRTLHGRDRDQTDRHGGQEQRSGGGFERHQDGPEDRRPRRGSPRVRRRTVHVGEPHTDECQRGQGRNGHETTQATGDEGGHRRRAQCVGGRRDHPRDPGARDERAGTQCQQPRDRQRAEQQQAWSQPLVAEGHQPEQPQERLGRGRWCGRRDPPDVVPAGRVRPQEPQGRGRPGTQLAATDRPGPEEGHDDHQREDGQRQPHDEHRVPPGGPHDPVVRLLVVQVLPDRGRHVDGAAGQPVGDRLAVRAQARGDTGEQRRQLPVAANPTLLDRAAQTQGLGEVDEVPTPGTQGLPGIVQAARRDEPEHLGDPDQEEQREHERQPRCLVALEQRRQRVALGEVARPKSLGLAQPLVVRDRPNVPGDRRGCDLHVVPRQPRPPTQIEIVAEDVVTPVETSEVVEHVAAHEHAGGRHVQDGPVTVTLALVELVGFEAGLGAPGQVDRHPHLLQQPGIVVIQQLGSDHPDPGIVDPVGHELRHHVRCRDQIVVQEQDPLRFGSRRDGGVQRHPDRCGEPQVSLGDEHAFVAQPVEQPLPAPVGRPAVDGDDLQRLVGLRRDGIECLLDPRQAVVDDEDREHGGSGSVDGVLRVPSGPRVGVAGVQCELPCRGTHRARREGGRRGRRYHTGRLGVRGWSRVSGGVGPSPDTSAGVRSAAQRGAHGRGDVAIPAGRWTRRTGA